jgi:hypothetical protein
VPYQDPKKKLEYQRRYQTNNRAALLEKKKERREEQRRFIWDAKRRPCKDCKKSFNPWIMDFDHVRGKKRFNLNRLCKVSASWETIKEEIEKCDVVCSNCHRERTHRRAGRRDRGRSGINVVSKTA